MRGWLTAIAVLALLILTDLVAGADSIDLTSNKHHPKIIEQRNTLSELFGFGRRLNKIDPSKVVIPEKMKQLYDKISRKERDTVAMPKAGIYTKTANTVRSFIHRESEIDKRFSDKRRFRLHFDISSIPKQEVLKAAELTVIREPVENVLGDHYQEQVLVYDIMKPGIKGKQDPILLLVDSKRIDIRQGGSISLDVVPAIERWIKYPKQNHGLIIKIVNRRKSQTIEHNHLRLRRSMDEDETNWSSKQPVLYTYTDDGKYLQRSGHEMIQNQRSKREKRKRKNGRVICRRRSLYVDFSDVGWNDWIVAPPGYDAFYCHGDCPFPLSDHLNTTNHAIVQNLVNGVNPSAVPKACCVPTTLSSISILYLDEENKVVLKNYQDMSVVGCGCR